jgi:hypothetical protein
MYIFVYIFVVCVCIFAEVPAKNAVCTRHRICMILANPTYFLYGV